MVAKRVRKPDGAPEGRTRVRPKAAAKAVKKLRKTKTPTKRSTTSSAKRSTKSSTTTSPKTAAAPGVAARRKTVARTRRLVDDTPLAVDDGDEVASRRIAALRAAKANPSDHRGRAKRSAVERAADPPAATGAALIERVSRAIERELTLIEVIVGGHHVAPRRRSEAERRARTLASLARTLREVSALRQSGRKEKREDDDAVPRDLDELRLALARRLDQLVADAKTAHPEGSD